MTLRPSALKIFRVWAFFVLTLFVVAPSDISGTYKILGTLAFLVIFFPWMLIGVNQKLPYMHAKNIVGSHSIAVLIVIQLICAEISITYYTGSSVVNALKDTLAGVNVYKHYQDHFRSMGIAQSPIWLRAHAIFALAFVKFVFLLVASLYFTRSVVVCRNILLLTATLTYAVVGLARGTFFEVFEIFIAFIYFISASDFLKELPRLQRKSAVIIAALIILAAPGLFIVNTIRRFEGAAEYFSVGCGVNFCFEPIGLNYYFEYAVFVLAKYFSMGLFFLGHLFSIGIEGFMVELLIPLYYNLLEVTGQGGVIGQLCSSGVTCRFVWVPDIIKVISIFGLLTPLAIAAIFHFVHKAERMMLGRYNAFSLPFIFTAIVFLLSLPVGSFYTVSSSTILCSGAFLVLWRVTKADLSAT